MRLITFWEMRLRVKFGGRSVGTYGKGSDFSVEVQWCACGSGLLGACEISPSFVLSGVAKYRYPGHANLRPQTNTT